MEQVLLSSVGSRSRSNRGTWKRSKLPKLAAEDWLPQLEENLNKKSKDLFWESYQEGEAFDQVIAKALGRMVDKTILNLREQIHRSRQRDDEDAIEFGHRLKALLEVSHSNTGGEYEVHLRTCYLSKIRLKELAQHQTTGALTDEEFFL